MDNLWRIDGSGVWLVVSHPSEKYDFVNWDAYSHNMWKKKSHVPVTTNQLYMDLHANIGTVGALNDVLNDVDLSEKIKETIDFPMKYAIFL